MSNDTLQGWTNGTDTYLARDIEHLRELHKANTGMDIDHEDALGDNGEWNAIDPEEQISAWTGESPRSGELLHLTAAEWLASERFKGMEAGGFLCSTEY